jgi:hypothetical protein
VNITSFLQVKLVDRDSPAIGMRGPLYVVAQNVGL